jgi:hypothetical protein
MVKMGENSENEENGFLAGKNSGPPPSLNAERPGGSRIEPGPWIYGVKSEPFKLAWVFNLIPDPPPFR